MEARSSKKGGAMREMGDGEKRRNKHGAGDNDSLDREAVTNMLKAEKELGHTTRTASHGQDISSGKAEGDTGAADMDGKEDPGNVLVISDTREGAL